MKKRMILFSLAVCLVIALLPVTALAADGDKTDFTGYYDVVRDVFNEVGFNSLRDYGKDCNRGLLWDLDGDGNMELLLGTYNGDSYQAEGFQLWTLHEGKPALLLKGNPDAMSTYSYYLAEYQGEDYFVVSYGTGGTMAATMYYHFYKIADPAQGEYEQVYYATNTHYTGGGDEYYINEKEATEASFDKLYAAIKNGTELAVETEGTRLDDILDSAPTVEPGDLWFQQYGHYVTEHYEKAEYKEEWEDADYYLLYIDADDIPELWIRLPYSPFGRILLSWQEGELVELTVDADDVVYTERSGYFYLPLQRMGMAQDGIYALSDGKIEMITQGTQEVKVDENGKSSVDSDGYLIMNYFWEGEAVSKTEYQTRLDKYRNEYVDPDKAIESYLDVNAYDYWGLGQLFAHMEIPLHSGTCGENVTWAFDEAAGKLTISGSGDMYRYSYGVGDELPWKSIKDTIKTVVIEEGVTSIGWGAFSECANLESVKLPGTLATVGMNAFYDCPKLTTVDMSACTNAPGGYAMFGNCDSLTSLDFFKLGYIPQSGFSGCDGFTVLNIPEGVTQVQSEAFSGCSNVREIIFPSSLTDIFPMAFYACNNVNVIRFNGDAPTVDEYYRPFDGVEGEGATPPIKATAYYPAGNPTWTEEAKAAMGGELTWVAYCTEHTFGDWAKTTAATCTAPGKETRTCTACGEAEERELPALGHTEVTDPAVSATCTTTGLTEGKHCSVCAAVLTAQETVPVTAHTFTDGKCTVCGEADLDWSEPTEPVEETFRVAGGNRFETANLVADQMKENLGIEKFNAVVVASGTEFADALAGSYLAAVKNAPILLSYTTDKINDGVKDYIKANLNPGGTVYILGGTNAVPENFKDGLEEQFTVKRLAGGNRFETNLLVLEEAGVGDKPILVCTGLDFADSLSASATKLPILLVYGDKLLPDQAAFLKVNQGRELYIIGGEGAVSAKLESALTAYGNIERVAGNNRFETSTLIAEKFFNSPESAVLAYAWGFPDGLCGGPLATTMNAPLILTMAKYEAKAADYIQTNAISNAVILGGEALIPESSVEVIFPSKNDLHENELPIG